LTNCLDFLLVPEEEDRDTVFQTARMEGQGIFFSHLQILPDGGLSRMGARDLLYSGQRAFFAGLSLFFVLFNQYTIFTSIYRISNSRPNRGEGGIKEFSVLIDYDSNDAKIEFWVLRLIVAVFESTVMALMGFYVLYIVLNYTFRITEEDMKHYRIWHQIYDVTGHILREMTNFSAMKTLSQLNPQTLGAALSLEMTKVEEGANAICVMTCFFIRRIILGSFGYLAFCVKFASVVIVLQDNHTGHYDMWATYTDLITLVGFVNQLFGMTQVWQIETSRLFLFIFGGADSAIQAAELDRQEAFLASVICQICTQAYRDDPPKMRAFKRCVALLCFSHLDIQSFLLQEGVEDPVNSIPRIQEEGTQQSPQGEMVVELQTVSATNC